MARAKIQNNYLRFANKLKEAGYNLLFTETAIVPVVCGSTDSAARLAKYCRDNGIFVQAIVAPVVPEGLARLRACISAAHTIEDIDYCADVIIEGGKNSASSNHRRSCRVKGRVNFIGAVFYTQLG